MVRNSGMMLLTAVLVTACAMPSPEAQFAKVGAGPADVAKDKQECDYEAMKAVNGYDPSMRSMLGQDLDLAMRRGDVAKQCMRVRGYLTR